MPNEDIHDWELRVEIGLQENYILYGTVLQMLYMYTITVSIMYYCTYNVMSVYTYNKQTKDTKLDLPYRNYASHVTTM